jgi:hypothetical protein
MFELPPLLDVTLIHLKAIRLSLLRLHKALLDSEREAYEQTHGQIQSQGELFQLVLEDEWFRWLRPISQFIVQIDEVLASREPVTLNQANQLIEQAHSLLKPDAEGAPSQQRYYQAIQRDPNIALMNADLSMLFAEG